MKDDTAAILMLNSFLNKSCTSNSLIPGCYHIHIQTKFFFITGLRNLVDRNKSGFSIPVTIFLSLKETHHLVVKKTFDETALPHDEDYTHTNCNSKVQLWSCQGACELKVFPS
jgi:hypothetical protein